MNRGRDFIHAILARCSCKKRALIAVLFILSGLSLLFVVIFVRTYTGEIHSGLVVLSDTESHVPQPAKLPKFDFARHLKDLYFAKYSDLEQKNLLVKYPKKKPCAKEKSPAVPCVDTRCQASLSHDLNVSISSLLTSIESAKGTFVDPLDDVTSGLPRSLLTIVTAASSNHFLEVQGLIKSLHENVFPKMPNISFYIYDLGLTRFELHQLKQFCRCQTITFPFHLMPGEVSHVKCYTWKPMIVQTHLKLSDIVIWADASVRLLPLDDTFFQDVKNKGLLISFPSRFYRPISHHTDARTFDYFHISPCSVTNYQELEATVIAFHQQPFITDLVAYVWALCALDANCMCPQGSVANIHCDYHIRKYSKCHRFDQSVITLILLKLFHDNYSTFAFDPAYFIIKRSETVQYFDTLISANKNKSSSD